MDKLLKQLSELLGNNGVLTGADVSSRAAAWGAGPCEAAAILRPRNTDEVSKILSICHAAGQPVVAQGGKTGLVQGCVAGPMEIALSLERMNKIEEVDIASRAMTVEAGVPLQAVQEAAESAGFSFPLDLGARGSATIGGNIATNAGGNRVIRHGMTRNLVLGIEAVLADGTIINSMSKVIKNNAAYDIKQLFIGSEGTLGIVTRAVLKLSPLLTSQNTVLAATDSFEKLTQLLNFMDRELGGQLSAFELMWGSYYQLATNEQATGKHSPMDRNYPYYIVMESMGTDQEKEAARFETLLEQAFEQGLIIDAVVAKSHRERQELWQIRDNIEAFADWWPVFVFDISLPISSMNSYLLAMEASIRNQWPGAKIAIFGHLGDGNLHLGISIGADTPELRHQVNEIVYGELAPLSGSLSAEHGIGLEKRNYLQYSRNPQEIALMRTIKSALDPKNILNPGKVLAPV
jgi:FAD/FMN-containing dehydrogenase